MKHSSDLSYNTILYDFIKYYLIILFIRHILFFSTHLAYSNYLYIIIDGIVLGAVGITLLFHHKVKYSYNISEAGKLFSIFLIILQIVYGTFSGPYLKYVLINALIFPFGIYLYYEFKTTLILTLITLLILPLNYLININYNVDTHKDYEIKLAFITYLFLFSFLFLIIYYYGKNYKEAFLFNKKQFNSIDYVIDEKLENIDDNTENKHFKNLFNEIELYLNKEKPWKDIDFDMNKLAKMTGYNISQISIAINYCANQNFKTYINGIRLEYFMELYNKNNDEKTSLKDIYLDIGFNSRVTFNRAFKKKFGKPPKEYLSSFD